MACCNTDLYTGNDSTSEENNGENDPDDGKDDNLGQDATSEFDWTIRVMWRTGGNDSSYTLAQASDNEDEAGKHGYFGVQWADENYKLGNLTGNRSQYKASGRSLTTDNNSTFGAKYMHYDYWNIFAYRRLIILDCSYNDYEGTFCGIQKGTENSNGRTSQSTGRYFIYRSNDVEKITTNQNTATSGCSTWLKGNFYLLFRKDYNISFNNNGGTGGPSSFTALAGIGYTMPSTKPTRTGYTFSGWSRSSPGGTIYNPGHAFDDSWVYSDDEWYANWTANTYGVSYNANGGRISNSPSLDSVTHISGYSFSLNSDGYYESSNNGVNNSYSLCRVNFTANAGTTVTFYVINYAESNYDFGIFSNLNTKLSSSYTEDTSNVYRSFKGSSSSSEQTVSYNITSSGTHYIYIKYRKDSSNSPYNDSLQFRMYGKSVTYNSTYGTLPTPTKTGYNFIGWYKNSGLTSKVTSSSTVSTARHHTLYAKWEIVTYTLTLYYAGRGQTNYTDFTISSSRGTVRNSTVAYPSGSDKGYVDCTYSTSSVSVTISLTNDANYDYYMRIGGMPTTSTYTKLYTTSNDSYTYYWTPTSNKQISIYIYQRYTITYDKNGGTGTLPSTTYKRFGTSVTLGTNNLTKTSYTANGWNTNTTGTGTHYASGGSYSTNASDTLYADWTPKTSTIKVQIKTSTDGVNYTNSATGGSVSVKYYYDNNNSPTQSTGTNVTSSSATTVATNVLIDQTVTLTPKANSGYVFVGASTGTTAPNSATAGTTFTPTTQNGSYTLYVYFKVLSTNQLKYDSTEKYWYFEEGEYPQSYVGTSMNNTLNSANPATSGTITYNNGSSNVTIGVYTYNSKRYAKLQAGTTQTLKMSDGTSYTFTQGQWYWFEVEPIRWRVSDYGVSSTSYPSGWSTYGTYKTNFTVVSDRVLMVGAVESDDVKEGWAFTSSDMYSNIKKLNQAQTTTNYSVNVSNKQSATGYKYYKFGSAGQQDKVIEVSQIEDGVRVASKEEIDDYLTDYSAKASDMVCFLLGCGTDDKVEYWTRNLGTNLGNGQVVGENGVLNSCWLDSVRGVRLSMTMGAGSRI